MQFFKADKNKYLDEFDEEQRLYDAAAKEFDDGESHPELRAKVLAEAYGSMEFARTNFIELRLQMLLKEKESGTTTETANTEILPPELPQTEVAREEKTEKLAPISISAETPPASPAIQPLNRKKIGGYLSLINGLIFIVIGLLYLSVGGIGRGLTVLTLGVVVFLVGAVLIKPFGRKH